MYEDYVIYGPYRDSKTGREIVVLIGTAYRTTMSYPRYLMSRHLGRPLAQGEEVDHINDDRSDNRLENLQLLSRADNMAKRSTGQAFNWFSCAQCGSQFSRSKQRQFRTAAKYPPCCTRSCAARYQMLRQHNAT